MAADGSPAHARPRTRAFIRVGIEAALVVTTYLAVSSYQERGLLVAGAAAPAFRLIDVDGRVVSRDALLGKRVVVHFWATWCSVCRREFGALEALRRGLSNDEALVTIVADSDDAEKIRGFVTNEEIKYTVLLGNEETLRAFRVTAFPTNYFVDREGRIASHSVGMSLRLTLAARLALAR